MFDVLAIPDSCLRQDLCVAIDRSESSCLRQFRVNRGQLKAKSAAPRLRRRDREVVYLTGFIDGWQTADLDAAGSLVHQVMIVAGGAIAEIARRIRISGLRTINGRVGDHAHEEHHYRCLKSSYAGQLHNSPTHPRAFASPASAKEPDIPKRCAEYGLRIGAQPLVQNRRVHRSKINLELHVAGAVEIR